MREIAITGVGVITPLGNDLESFYTNLSEGRSGISKLAIEGLEEQVGAAVSNFDSARWFSRQQLTGVDRVSQLSGAAAIEALADSRIGLNDHDPFRIGVYMGCSFGGAATLDIGYRTLYAQKRRVPALTILGSMCNAPASHISIRHGIRGPVMTYSMACASGTIALGEAMRALRSGQVDVALAGGTEAMLSYATVLAWESLHTLAQTDKEDATRSCKPFSADRSGLVLGEGSVVFVLEDAKEATRKGRRVRGKLVGYGTATDASHITKPDIGGQVEAMARALRDSKLQPSDIGYINAHGTATLAGDIVETRAIKAVWGGGATVPPVSSTKSMHGHLMGAAGAVELAAALMSIERGIIPPTINLRIPDPECDLDYVPNESRAIRGLRFAMSNSFGFGGSNASLVVSRADD